jgi:hypothetical protein
MEEPIGIGNDAGMGRERPGSTRTDLATNPRRGIRGLSGGQPAGAKDTQGTRIGQHQVMK